MKRPLIVAAALTAAVVLIGTVALVLWRASPPQPRLVLPAVDRFAPGACRDAAEAVRSLARLTHGAEVAALSVADRAELRRVQDRPVALRPAATVDVREPMEAVILTLGYLRLRLEQPDRRAAVPARRGDGPRPAGKTCVRVR